MVGYASRHLAPDRRRVQTMCGLENLPEPLRDVIPGRHGAHLAGFCAATSRWIITSRPGMVAGSRPWGPAHLLPPALLGLLKEPTYV